MNRAYTTEDNDLDKIENRPQTTLLTFFDECKKTISQDSFFTVSSLPNMFSGTSSFTEGSREKVCQTTPESKKVSS